MPIFGSLELWEPVEQPRECESPGRSGRSPSRGAAPAVPEFQGRVGRGSVSLKLRGSCHLPELPGEETRVNQRVGEKQSLGEHSLPLGVFK